MTKPLLRTIGLARQFAAGDRAAVENVSLAMEEGEIMALLGPSGCGKTTTLRMIAGLEQPDRGAVYLHENNITALPPERRQIGLVFQDYALFPHLNVRDNVVFALWRERSKSARRKQALELLETVGMASYAKRMPHELSGGQQQRVALMRALAAAPRLLLMDEPFSNLDAALRQSTRAEIQALLRQKNMSCILVTHDQEEAMSFADRIALMKGGRIEQTGTPEDVYGRPRTSFAARFLGRTNLIPGIASGGMADTPIGTIPICPAASGPVMLSLRPEHLEMQCAGCNDPAATLVRREFKGHDMTHWVRLGDMQLQVDTDFTCMFKPGSRVCLKTRQPAVVLEEMEDNSSLLRMVG